MSVRIDGLQYCAWDRARFLELQQGGVHAAHVTVCYHEDFRETVDNIASWHDLFCQHHDLIMPGKNAQDVRTAKDQGKTAIFFGFQNCSPIEDDIHLVEVCHALGARFMQLTYNNQSLLAGGCAESFDGGVTRMGREVIMEMNRTGLVVDMSHSGETSTLQAIELSQRPIAITHANPAFWLPSARNKSDSVLRALGQSGGMLGLSLYPHHLKNGSDCSLSDFCQMAARAAEMTGVGNLGIGSDLCRGQPDQVVRWMRNGKWRKSPPQEDLEAVFPPQPEWFQSAADFEQLNSGLRNAGFNQEETADILGENWLRFFENSFAPAP